MPTALRPAHKHHWAEWDYLVGELANATSQNSDRGKPRFFLEEIGRAKPFAHWSLCTPVTQSGDRYGAAIAAANDNV